MTTPSAQSAEHPTGSSGIPAATRSEAVVDLDAISANVAALRSHVGGRDLMAVVKADGYGHGIVQAAEAARRGGADWIGVAFLDEALRLRAAGDRGPLMSWLATPGERYDEGVAAGVDVAAHSVDQLREIGAAAERVGGRADVHLKLDTGMGRGGATAAELAELVEVAVGLQRVGRIDVAGVMSHLACADEPGHPSIAAQVAVFETGVDAVRAAGLEPRHLHLANSAGTLSSPHTWFTLVRPGMAIYGVSPMADGTSPVPLLAAMTLRSHLAQVKRVPAGQGVSYGLSYVTDRETTLALVPLGYGDGVPRHGSGVGPVLVGGSRFTVAGRVCMDQFVVDVGDLPVRRGDEVVLFGRRDRGEPTANEWAAAAGTIGYEIVTRVSPRVPRRYLGPATR